MKKYIIIAPHADDEIIGCHEYLNSGLVESVIFGSSKACEEAIPSSDHFKFSIKTLDELMENLMKTFLFPDPIYESHPEHRKLGAIGENLLRLGVTVVFYSTNMNAPYIHEVKDVNLKLHCLNTLYLWKSDLWQYDHKYYLFEGYNHWLMPLKT